MSEKRYGENVTRVILIGSAEADAQVLLKVHKAIGPTAVKRGTLTKGEPTVLQAGRQSSLEFTLRHRAKNNGNGRHDADRFVRRAIEQVSRRRGKADGTIRHEILNVTRREEEKQP